jgi:hypothetical protein
MQTLFERGVVVISIDTELIWGYRDLSSEAQFQERFPDAVGAHEKLLVELRTAEVSATWYVVGALALGESAGERDPRMAGLPTDWIAGIPDGGPRTAPVWYRAPFVKRLHETRPAQEVGLHGGLTHLIWTDRRATREVVTWELAGGIKALEQAHIRPRSFSFGRNQEAYHELLPEYGIRSYRGRSPGLAWKLGQTLPGALLRASDELRRATPPLVWPHESLPGLWCLPASLSLYPIGPARARFTGLRSRVERFSRGLGAAVRDRGIFHFCLHPENLAESRFGFSIFEEMIERLVRARDLGDVEILTVIEVVDRMEGKQTYAQPKQQSNTDVLEANRRC